MTWKCGDAMESSMCWKFGDAVDSSLCGVNTELSKSNKFKNGENSHVSHTYNSTFLKEGKQSHNDKFEITKRNLRVRKWWL